MRPSLNPPIFRIGTEEVATLDTDDRADDRGVRTVAEARDQVLDATDPAAVRIEDRSCKNVERWRISVM